MKTRGPTNGAISEIPPLPQISERARAASTLRCTSTPRCAGILCSVALFPIYFRVCRNPSYCWVPTSRREGPPARVGRRGTTGMLDIPSVFFAFRPTSRRCISPLDQLNGGRYAYTIHDVNPAPPTPLPSAGRYEGQLTGVVGGATQTWDSLDEEDLSTLDDTTLLSCVRLICQRGGGAVRFARVPHVLFSSVVRLPLFSRLMREAPPRCRSE